MSGGSYDYAQDKINDIADGFESRNDHKAIRRQFGSLLRHLGEIAHDIEWIDSGDYGQEDWEKMVIPKLKSISKINAIKTLKKELLREIEDMKKLLDF